MPQAMSDRKGGQAMRRLAALAVLVIALRAAAVVAETPALASRDRAAIRGVIEAQLEAFRADDGARAFSFASPGIQGLFHDPDTFMRMVREGYQPVYRPRAVEFRDLVPLEGRWTQRVLFVGPDGVPVIARYPMQRQPDGSWRIDGCVLERVLEQRV
jgi:hypothetical protein